MIDPFGILDPDLFNEANQAHAVNYFAILIALDKKGIITLEEYEEAKILAISVVEQEFAKKRDDAERQFEVKYPDLAWLVKKLRGDSE